MTAVERDGRDLTHPTTRLDDVVHQRARLGVLTILAVVHDVEFTVLRDELGLTDGNLGRHLQALTEAGLIRLKRQAGMGRQRTTASLTTSGRTALRAELSALRELVTGLEGIGL